MIVEVRYPTIANQNKRFVAIVEDMEEATTRFGTLAEILPLEEAELARIVVVHLNAVTAKAEYILLDLEEKVFVDTTKEEAVVREPSHN